MFTRRIKNRNPYFSLKKGFSQCSALSIKSNSKYSEGNSNENSSRYNKKALCVFAFAMYFCFDENKEFKSAKSHELGQTNKLGSVKRNSNIVVDSKKIASLLDLTTLNDSDNEETIVKLVHKASRLGPVAAICIYPRLIDSLYNELVKEEKNNPDVKLINIATVVNFPKGNDHVIDVCAEIPLHVKRGAEEIDIVIPYKDVCNGNFETTALLIRSAKEACGEKIPLKVILESGFLQDPILIRKISKVVIENGADFLKTSTGKIPVGATLEAAEAMLSEIKINHDKTGKWIGFKVSGGVRTREQAEQYILLARLICGDDFITEKTFRIGASSLIDDLYSKKL